MAKKKVETPVYPVAPLKITKEKFCGLLTEQINKGNDLFRIDVPRKAQSNPYYGYGGGFLSSGRISDKVEYDDVAENAFVASYKRWRDRCKSIYQTSFTEPESCYYHDFESQIWSIWGSDTIKEYKDNIQRLVNHMQGDIERVDLIECLAEKEEPKAINKSKELSRDIFIVHGHNEEMKQTVARVVTKLGLNPIILHEQANEGRTIIDKFETNAENIQFAIILLSGDDSATSIRNLEGAKDEEIKSKLEKRARQNVVFEMGYFAGKLGRNRLFYLLQDGVAKPGDLDGLVYTPYDTVGVWKFSLVKELKACGYNVDANNVL